MLYEEKIIETIPVGPLGLIPLKGISELGEKVDRYLVEWRHERESEHKSTIAFSGRESPISLRPRRPGSVPVRPRGLSRSRCAEMICILWWTCAITV